MRLTTIARRAMGRIAAPVFVRLFSRPERFERIVVWGLYHLVPRLSPDTALPFLFRVADNVDMWLNSKAIEYDGQDQVHPKHRLTAYHDFFVDRIHPGDRVLDIGCGIGAVANSVAVRSGAYVVGLDLSEKSIEFARQNWRSPNLQFMVGDARYDLPDEHFDVVVLSNVLEHIEDRVDLLRAIQRKVTPGRFLIRVPLFERDWRVALRKELGLFYFSDPTHYIEYTVESFKAEMRQAGLNVTELQVRWGEIWAEVAPHA